jgi:site-specific DNA-methyltransferase (adenine-specific)
MNICIDAQSGLQALKDESVALIFTSPPYANQEKYSTELKLAADKYIDWIMPIIAEMPRVLKNDGSFILNIDDGATKDGFTHPYVYYLVCTILNNTEFKLYDKLFWNKLNSLPQRKRFAHRIEYLFWFSKNPPKMDMNKFKIPYTEGTKIRWKRPIQRRHARIPGAEKVTDMKKVEMNPLGALPSNNICISSISHKISDDHVASFPFQLPLYFIKGTTDEGDLVCDPFAGIGQTGVAARKLNREYIGFDINQGYVDQANARLEKALELRV